MCGRYTLRTESTNLRKIFQATIGFEPAVRFNIAPTQSSPVCIQTESGEREILSMRWGLIPSWARDGKLAASMINARGETIDEKPSFRTAFKCRRCLVPMSGFYEWFREGKTKTPYHIHREDDSPFAVAGIWERWEKGGFPVETYSIITTAANSFMQSIHDRMPVILGQELFGEWLNPTSPTPLLQSFLEPVEWTGFEIVQVSDVVNNARNDVPECIVPDSSAS